MPQWSAIASLLVILLPIIHSHALVNSHGLAFVSTEAYCHYHCHHMHISAASECTMEQCGAVAHRILAAPGRVHASKGVETIDLLSCRQHSVQLTMPQANTNIFQGFYDAFSHAYNAMVTSSNASYEACALQAIQDQFFINTTHRNASSSSSLSSSNVRRPMLIKLHQDQNNQLTCIQQIKTIWTPDDENFTPFLTRSDQQSANTTIMLMHVTREIADRIVALECVESVVSMPSILKLTPFARSSIALARQSDQTHGPALEIRLVRGLAYDQIVQRLQQRLTAVTGIQNLVTQRHASDRIVFTQAVENFAVWAQVIAVILENPDVEWVDLQIEVTTGAIQTMNALESRLLRHRRLDTYVRDLVGVQEARNHGITGNDIIIGVTDTGLYVNHDQFDQESREIFDQVDLEARKVVLYRAFANKDDESEHVTCGHGTHVSGILAGSSNSKQSEDMGIASSARIAFMDIGKQNTSCQGQAGCPVRLETPGDVEVLMQDQVSVGAKIFSFSWGTAGSDYSSQARDLDNFIYNHPEILIIVAAGNSGDKGKQTISSPSGAKNVISVGASLNDADTFSKSPCPSVLNKQTVASFSSAGPTLDGRQKPDVVAPGMVIQSAQSEPPGSTVTSSAICPLQGTSQSTPVVAGLAVLLYEWLRDGWWKNGVKDPAYGLEYIPAALLKALIIHSGERMTKRLVAPRNGVTSCVAMEAAAERLEQFPDFDQGYGKPSMANLAYFGGSNATTPNDSNGGNAGAGVYFYPNSTKDSEPSVKEGESSVFHFVLVENTNLRVTLVWTDPAGSIGSMSVLQNDLDLVVRVPGTPEVFYPLSGNGQRDDKNNVEMVEVTYKQIVDVATKHHVSMDRETGAIAVEAIVYGYSVKANPFRGQPFALVASSSPIEIETKTLSQATTGFWQPWMTIGSIVAATMVILLVIALVWRIRSARERAKWALDGKPGQEMMQLHTSPQNVVAFNARSVL